MDTDEDYKRQKWEEDNPDDYDECEECGAMVKLGPPYMYGGDADGNRGMMVRDIDDEHICNEYAQESADVRREGMENR